jgi:GntR family transcriptional regulator/MocR family aminotransferase
LTTIPVDHQSAIPLHRQIYSAIRHAILSRQLLPETKLPSTRFLSTNLGISRNTVVNAFDQLFAEGYLATRQGSGTYVAQVLPEGSLAPSRPTRPAASHPLLERRPSQRGTRLLEMAGRMPMPLTNASPGTPRAFREGVPAGDLFPHKVWGRLLSRTWRYSSQEILSYGGWQPLREATAAYLGTSRGVRCTERQIIIVSGSQQGINLAGQVLLDPGAPVWVEDPGYPGAYGGLLAAGAQVIPVPVDREGLDVNRGIAEFPAARLAFVTPSHQFPLGVTMSLKRRLELLEWANRNDAWILEDDYDSEYRYAGHPLATLQAIDRENRVIYLGTFSKVMFPALRLGYMVVPNDLVEAFQAARKFAIQHPPLLEQAVMAEFISKGHFVRHIRRMRAIYGKRQELLVTAARCELEGRIEIEPSEGGMHLLGWLPDGMDDVFISRKAAAHGVDASPLSNYSYATRERGALLLGFAGINEKEIQDGVRRLAKALG